ncbi:uncharacterized protein CTRU02_201134 [Colletotrichum truncatum]|uniref:Uncharacterized protein n=1 Tax=Colletotrichum truncatum TaxID=5467 RepID=A0ACC3ZH13_COLTU|nr:uncharacterized protein CTRU02_12446 [Colletotrichum truncatum]KAF6784741.1 hypothetical protein CTRU02_12446 [Colletotrichum truncatum]
MKRLQTAKDAKLRSACDRCHDMKNRCTRFGGIESRCDRCERLDADCVYSTRSQVGRPKTRKQEAALTARESSQSLGPTTSRLVPLDDAEVRLGTTLRDGTLQFDFDSSASSSSSSSQPAHLSQHFWEVDLSANQTTHCNEGSEWQLDSAIFMDNSPSYGDNTVASGSAHEDPVGLSPQHRNLTPNGAEGDVNGTTDTLIRLQSQLQQLLFGTLNAPKEDMPLPTGHKPYPAVDKVLGLTNQLLEIVQAQIQTNPNTEQLARNMNRITTLQIMTCYTYVVQLLSPIITTARQQNASDSNLKIQMATQCPSPSLEHMFPASRPVNGPPRLGSRYPVLHLGGFNLASQPVLNEDVVQHMVQRIMQQLHMTIQSFASVAGCGKIVDAVDANLTGGVLSPASPLTAGDANVTSEGL